MKKIQLFNIFILYIMIKVLILNYFISRVNYRCRFMIFEQCYKFKFYSLTLAIRPCLFHPVVLHLIFSSLFLVFVPRYSSLTFFSPHNHSYHIFVCHFYASYLVLSSIIYETGYIKYETFSLSLALEQTRKNKENRPISNILYCLPIEDEDETNDEDVLTKLFLIRV